ncbi:MAG: SurA N-terminal domain-containing protein [Deltaproteobacteria bacterium]|nr:SurA N-terminal domain-containing protein [Sandaracinaceae bacterium]MCX7807749.1 SurA N-terminal domain-containing protein [Deltaproteobacteria bacterium]MDW8247547.1 SurA N-terminal domain-containing protein [Sandaracinaceae bacterium]
MEQRGRRIWFWVVFFLVSSGSSHAEVLERVVAVVNDQAIFLSELRARAIPRLSAAVPYARSEGERHRLIRQIYQEELERLIEDKLVEQQAQQEHISVSDSEIENAIRNIRTQAGLSEARFWEIVREQGLSREDYRRDLKRQLLRYKLLNLRVRSRINITEDEVRARYEEMASQARKHSRFNVAYILVPLSSDPSPTEVAGVSKKAQSIRNQITDASSFEAVMREMGGGELGWLNQGDLDPNLERVIATMEIGSISQPVRGPGGFFIFLLRDREQGDSRLGRYEDVKLEIYRRMLEEAMSHQERIFFDELRREATIDRRLDR